MNQSILKAHRLLELLMASGPMSLSDLASAADMHRSSAHRLLVTLQELKLVDHGPDRRYRLGLGAIMLGQAAIRQQSIVRVATPHMSALVERLQETASLVLFEDREAYCVHSVEAQRSMRAGPQRPGTKIPLHCSGSGKILLAHLEDGELRALLHGLRLEPRTPQTIVDRDALLADIQEVRRRGYAIDDQELETGLICVAAPLRDYTGGVVGALSLSGHCVRIEGYGTDRVAEEVAETALAISVDLGYSAPRRMAGGGGGGG
ncbi:MAG: IclR family transcriptional regulator [Dactylosporangium sp.]|nr:IclR family transcriptional regulator [Dactylosporangium sp.]